MNDPESIAGRAGNDEGAEPEPELFPMGAVDAEDGVSHKQLIAGNLPVQLTVSITKAEVPSRGKALFRPGVEQKILLTVEPGEVNHVPQFEGDRPNRKVVGWKLRQKLTSVYAERVSGDTADVEAAFALLQDADPRKAGELLDRLQARLAESLQTA